MKYLILIILIQFTISSNLYSQDYSLTDNHFAIELGVGNSMYDKIQSQQFLIFLDTPYLRSSLGGLELSSKINFESIRENQHNTFLVGIVPFLKYNIVVQQISLFLKGGIGVNYINNHNIDSRNLGGHFIFSDMIGVGINLLQNTFYSFEISYLFRHISNAGFYGDNEGYNSEYLLFTFTI